jgi:NAD-dependent deacetylase
MRIDLCSYSRIVILTGAGISAASGLRTFRGSGGVWEEYNVEEFGNARALKERPLEMWRLFGGMRASVQNAIPNPAHLALARWEARLGHDQQFLLVTQNVDALHQRAGSRRVVELHGNIAFTRCSNTACNLEPYHDTEVHDRSVPRCPKCGSALRPDVVLFGEAIPALASWETQRALRDCDLFIAIGTSGMVAPAANFVRSAEYAGARTILVNLEAMSPPDPAFKEEYLGKAEEVLPRLLGLDS